MPSSLELEFDYLWNYLHPNIDLETEVKLIPKRRFRFDYVHFPSMVAIELNGGIFTGGGHSRGKAQQRDYEKILLATALGYSVINLGTGQVNEENLELIKRSIEVRLIGKIVNTNVH